jgi:hypothetical protein
VCLSDLRCEGRVFEHTLHLLCGRMTWSAFCSFIEIDVR